MGGAVNGTATNLSAPDGPIWMLISEQPPDTLLVREYDRGTGRAVLLGSMTLVGPDEVLQTAHELSPEGLPQGIQTCRMSRQRPPGEVR